MKRKQFFKLWVNHALLTVLFKICNFYILNILLEHYISLKEFPLYGASIYLPTAALLIIVPKFLEHVNEFQGLKACLKYILILFLIFLCITAIYDVSSIGLLIGLTCLVFLASLESIFFDKVIATYVSYHDLPLAINTTRMANTIGYILGPLIGGIFFIKLSFQILLELAVLISLIYWLFLYLISWNLCKNNLLQEQFDPQEGNIPVNPYSILYLFSTNFVWINLVSIMFIPYFSLHFNVSDIGIILTFAGFGMLAGNLFSIAFLKYIHYSHLYILSVAGVVLSLIVIARWGNNYILCCLFVGLGSLFSSSCYALAQYFSLSIVDNTSLLHFYSTRNFMNILISILLFLLLWGLLSSPVSILLQTYFHMTQSGLMATFFGVITLVLCGLGIFFTKKIKI